MAISTYLSEGLVLFLNVKNQEGALKALVQQLAGVEKIPNAEEFYKAILQREKVVSTGIGLGIAIPHAKIANYSEFFIAIGIQSGKGIDWNAMDQAPVQLIFMIGGPDNRQEEYLQILSRLTSLLKEESFRRNLLRASSAKEVIKLFEGCESYGS